MAGYSSGYYDPPETDYDPPSFTLLRQTGRRARRDLKRRCGACGGKIEKGQHYEEVVWKDDDNGVLLVEIHHVGLCPGEKEREEAEALAYAQMIEDEKLAQAYWEERP